MKNYKMKIGNDNMYVVEIGDGIPLMFNTQEKAEDFIKEISNQPERSKREDTQFVYRKPDGKEDPVRFLKFKE